MQTIIKWEEAQRLPLAQPCSPGLAGSPAPPPPHANLHSPSKPPCARDPGVCAIALLFYRNVGSVAAGLSDQHLYL